MKVFFYLVSTLYLFASCKKDKENIPVYSICPEGLLYYNLPLNSYYIYRDSATANLDSVVVKESTVTTNFAPATPGGGYFSPGSSSYYYESYNLLMNKISGLGEEEWFKGVVKMGCVLSDFSGNEEFGYAFSYPLAEFSSISANTTLAEYIIPTLTIEGKIYSDVAVFMKANVGDPTKDYYRKTTYYWAKGAGIIKREIVTGTSIKTNSLVRKG